MGTPANYADNAATSAITLNFPELDPLVSAMCASTGPPAWVISVDPMLEELAASLIMSWPARTPTLGCLPTQAVASQEVEAPLVNTLSLETAAQWTTDSPRCQCRGFHRSCHHGRDNPVSQMRAQRVHPPLATRRPRRMRLLGVSHGSPRRCSLSDSHP
jgi:hypothetical protein